MSANLDSHREKHSYISEHVIALNKCHVRSQRRVPNDRETARDSIPQNRRYPSKNPSERVSERKPHSAGERNFISLKFSNRIRCRVRPFAVSLPRMAARKRSYRGSTVHVACVRITCPTVASRVAAARVQRYTGTKREAQESGRGFGM